MSNKIALVYENGEFNIDLNGAVISNEKDLEDAFNKFKQVIKNNVVQQADAWETIVQDIKTFSLDDIEINDEYKTINFGIMKYFYNTGKVFYMGNGQMLPLTGGYNLFKAILTLVAAKKISDYEGLVELCVIAMENHVPYRMTASSIILSSPGFNYGSAEYDFTSSKIHKGASSESGSFEMFKAYVLHHIKK